MPSASMAWASRARTWVAEYRSVGRAMRSLYWAVIDLNAVKRELTVRARALGFGALGVPGVPNPEDERHLLHWLAQGFHGEMHYMQRHGVMRSRPEQLSP